MPMSFSRSSISLIETGKANLDGKYIKALDAQLGIPPVQEPRPPLYFGGSSDAAIEFSGRFASTNI